ncbi:MAG TPA: right-handed parallel beta-helix repeat-containing protein [Candidatus Limnocylindrales bacterium]|nr:right-handed parallel beta-helix repeat-containing protein [Candidatus Limnocylindrales bacterium]
MDLAITASQRGDVILLAPGTYPGAVVPLDKPDITIRGEDRNTVIFDGEDRRPTAIRVAADGVTIENLSAHDFTADGFAWDGADGFAGRYLTVWNVGRDGIATRASTDGVIEDSYVSAAAGSGVAIEACEPCATTVRRVTATLSAVGFSALNTGEDLVVEDSRFQLNGVGMLLGSFQIDLEPPPQHDAVLRRNEVVGSGTVVTPRISPWAGYHGVGIGIAGGQSNRIEDNDVSGSARYGIAVFTAVDRTTSWYPARNQVTGNQVFESAIADLAVAGGSGQANCFADNAAAIALPAGIAGTCASFGTTDPRVEADLARAPHDLLAGMPEAPDYSSMTPPVAQPTMPIALLQTPSPGVSVEPSPAASSPVLPAPSQIPAASSGESVILAASVIILALFCVVILLVAFRVVPRRR